MKMTCEGISDKAVLQDAIDAAVEAAGRIILDQTGATDQLIEWTIVHVYGSWQPGPPMPGSTGRSLTVRIEFVIPRLPTGD